MLVSNQQGEKMRGMGFNSPRLNGLLAWLLELTWPQVGRVSRHAAAAV